VAVAVPEVVGVSVAVDVIVAGSVGVVAGVSDDSAVGVLVPESCATLPRGSTTPPNRSKRTITAVKIRKGCLAIVPILVPWYCYRCSGCGGSMVGCARIHADAARNALSGFAFDGVLDETSPVKPGIQPC
jgi:hypothetical protein